MQVPPPIFRRGHSWRSVSGPDAVLLKQLEDAFPVAAHGTDLAVHDRDHLRDGLEFTTVEMFEGLARVFADLPSIHRQFAKPRSELFFHEQPTLFTGRSLLATLPSPFRIRCAPVASPGWSLSHTPQSDNGLPGPVRAEEGHELAGLHIEVEAAHGLDE